MSYGSNYNVNVIDDAITNEVHAHTSMNVDYVSEQILRLNTALKSKTNVGHNHKVEDVIEDDDTPLDGVGADWIDSVWGDE